MTESLIAHKLSQQNLAAIASKLAYFAPDGGFQTSLDFAPFKRKQVNQESD